MNSHLVEWYSRGFWLATFSLVLWHAVKDKDNWSKLAQFGIVAGITLYAVSFSFIHLQAGPRLLILSRDFLMMGVISLFFNTIRNLKKFYWLAVIVLYALSKMGWGKWQANTLRNAEVSITKEIKDENEWELLVQLDDLNALPDLKPILDQYNLGEQISFNLNDKAKTDIDNFISIEIPEYNEGKITEIKSALSRNSHVIWIEDNETIAVEPIKNVEPYRSPFKPLTNDPYSDQQWSLESQGWNHIVQMQRDGILKPTKRARIFILDSGIDGNHEDLKDNYVSLDKKYDTDEVGHGTHVAGIADAVSNNNIGIASVSPGKEFCSITSIKVLGRFGAGTQRDVINGILKAADEGADVINLSLGGRSLDAHQKAFDEAVSYANGKGAIIVAAAGNDNADATNYSPANVRNVIAVSAIDQSNHKASFSNSVEQIKYKIAAPGFAIFSCMPGNQYSALNGTSMAAPFVTGLIGLMKSIKPDLDTKEAYRIIDATGKESLDDQLTGKVIVAEKAIKMCLDRVN